MQVVESMTLNIIVIRSIALGRICSWIKRSQIFSEINASSRNF